MFGRTFPSGIHYTGRGTQCYGNVGNVVPGADHWLCSKKTADVRPSVKQRCEARLGSVRRSTLRVCFLTAALGKGQLCDESTGTQGASAAHRWAHFPSSSLSHARPLPQLWLSPRRERGGSEKQEDVLSASSPISSLIACQPRLWL